MSAPTGEIDWDEAERRERRRDLLNLLGIAAFFVGMVLVTGGLGFVSGRAAWAVVGVLLVFLLSMSAASHLIPRLRENTSGGYRIQTALSRHIDPGPRWRARTDRQARYLAGARWIGWAAPMAPIAFLLDGQWDRPAAAATGTVLIVAASAAWMLWWRRRLSAARRWLADPPGPPREALPPTAAESWLTGSRGLAVIVGSAAALALVAVLVGALL